MENLEKKVGRSISTTAGNATINDQQLSTYINFGSNCNTIKLSAAKHLGIRWQTNESVIIGYGGAQVKPAGVLRAKIEIDNIALTSDFFVVPDDLQLTELLIGQPITESKGVLLYKTVNFLKLTQRNFCEYLPRYDSQPDNNNSVKLCCQDHVTIQPGVNFIWVNADLEKGELAVTGWPQFRESILVVPSGNIKLTESKGMLVVMNIGLQPLPLEANSCLARGIKKITQEKKIQDERVRRVIEKYPSCFGKNFSLLSNIDLEMRIELTSTVPVSYKPYRLSLFEREKVRQIVEDLVDKGIVEPTTSAYSSPILLVKKKTNDLRMVVDYRKLNDITVKDRYPLPLIEDLLDRISNNTVFTTLDLKSGYHQIRMAEDSKKYTAFITPDGHYHYNRMPFGLTNAPAVFQRGINLALGPLRHTYVLVYIDDILIMSESEQEGIERLEEVLKTLNRAGLTLNLDKCQFLKSSVEYLGSEIRQGTIAPSPTKLKAVQDFPVPTNVHQTRQFLGLASYFRKFIRGFALKARPLTQLLKKNRSWNWTTEQQNAFDDLKRELTKSPVLAIFNPDRETQIHTDASKEGIGGVLLQKQLEWKPVAYMSRHTCDAETRYHSYELETLAVFETVKRFRNFLYGRHFTIVTDCNAMRMTWTKKDLSPRVGRWWLAMQDYDFTIEHRPGTQMCHVDALSRNPVIINKIKTGDWVCAIQANDEDMQLLKRQIMSKIAEESYSIVDDKVCKDVNGTPKIIIPRDVRWRIVKMFHDDNGHPGWQRTLKSINQTYWFSEMQSFVKKFVMNCIACMISKGKTGKRKGELYPLEKVAQPFHTLHADHVGPFCQTELGNTHILSIIDGFTKFVWLEPVPNASSKFVCKKLEELIKLVHVPKRIITDRGKAFDCKEFKRFCEKYNIRHVKNAIASPRSNGQVERTNKTVLESLRASVEGEHDNWDTHLVRVQRGINSTQNATTGIAPSELLYGFRPEVENEVRLSTGTRPDLKMLRLKAKERCDLVAKKMKKRYDKSRIAAEKYKVGDTVLVERTLLVKGLSSGKLVPKYIGPVQITEVLGNDRYRVVSFSKDKRRFKGVVASDRLRLFKAQIAGV